MEESLVLECILQDSELRELTMASKAKPFCQHHLYTLPPVVSFFLVHIFAPPSSRVKLSFSYIAVNLDGFH